MTKKILILSVSQVGEGHTRAAEAIKKCAEIHYPTLDVTVVDLMQYCPKGIRKMTQNSYTFLAKQTPTLWGFMYQMADYAEGPGLLRTLITILEKCNKTPFISFLKKEKWDAIVCTHAFAAQVLSYMRETHPHLSWSTIITDFALHEFWIAKATDHYFVSTEEMKRDLAKRGIEKERVTVSGIPVDPAFFCTPASEKLRKQYHIHPGNKVILLLSGGQGFTKLDRLIPRLFKLSLPCAIIAITGKNARLFEKINRLSPPSHIQFLPLQWTEIMHEYMAIADVVVTKPGGLTTSECLALGKPMLIIDPLPGQETKNAAFLERSSLGKMVTADTLFDALERWDVPKPKTKKTRQSAQIILDIIEDQLPLSLLRPRLLVDNQFHSKMNF